MARGRLTESVSLAEVERIVFRLTRELMTHDEPIPGFSTRFPNVLESCLAIPFQKFAQQSPYQTISQKAAVLFYLMIKNHPLQNGNKRVAMTTLFYFLYKNKKWLRVDQKKLYNFAVWVAESLSELKNETLQATDKFIRKYLVSLK